MLDADSVLIENNKDNYNDILGNKVDETCPPEYECAYGERVIDGDTVLIDTGQKLRYIGIDSPESKRPNTPIECFAEKSSDFILPDLLVTEYE